MILWDLHLHSCTLRFWYLWQAIRYLAISSTLCTRSISLQVYTYMADCRWELFHSHCHVINWCHSMWLRSLSMQRHNIWHLQIYQIYHSQLQYMNEELCLEHILDANVWVHIWAWGYDQGSKAFLVHASTSGWRHFSLQKRMSLSIIYIVVCWNMHIAKQNKFGQRNLLMYDGNFVSILCEETWSKSHSNLWVV